MSGSVLPGREPMKRRPAGNDYGMNLPAGKTCADCNHFRRCNLMFGHIAADEVCDWAPSRFWAKADSNPQGLHATPQTTQPDVQAGTGRAE